jgi:hypothetical protein
MKGFDFLLQLQVLAFQGGHTRYRGSIQTEKRFQAKPQTSFQSAFGEL